MEPRKPKLIDLSVPLVNNALYDPQAPVITYVSHRDAARLVAKNYGIDPEDFPAGLGLARESVTLTTHNGTHIDAPWHYGPLSEGRAARTIDEIPLEWCFGDGVRLDLRFKSAGEEITIEDLGRAVREIDYRIKALDIVLIWTGTEQYWNHPKYIESQPGLGSDATRWLLDQGVRTIGIDAWGLDIPVSRMIARHKEGQPGSLWPAHMLGRDREYIQIEKLCNLGNLPGPTGFRVAAFPTKISGASAGWCRAVAIVE